MKTKNPHAAALGRLGRGKAKTMSTLAIKARRANVLKAQAARWGKQTNKE